MSEDEMRYRVSAVVTSTLQIVVQARSSEEAEILAASLSISDAITHSPPRALSAAWKPPMPAKRSMYLNDMTRS